MLPKILFCVALQLALTCLVTAQGREPRQSAVINGRNYYFSPIATPIRDARQACQDINFELASFETETEFLQVTFYMSTQGLTSPYYTSGVNINGDWLWSSSGYLLKYNRWALLQPDYGTAVLQSCVTVQGGYLYDNVGCTEANHFICEQRDC